MNDAFRTAGPGGQGGERVRSQPIIMENHEYASLVVVEFSQISAFDIFVKFSLYFL